MKKFLTVILLILFSSKIFSQANKTHRSFQIQFEALGPGSLFSFNIDSRFSKKGNGLGYRIGIGGSPLGIFGETCNTGAQISLPLGLNYLVGKKVNLLEFGAGASFTVIAGTKVYCPDLKETFFGDGTESYGYLLAGYRFQPKEKNRLTYRVFISPLFQNNFPIKFWGGASVGYIF